MLRYFVADLHLDDKRPDIIRAFVHFLQEKAATADELYLLGDIFEAWIGDDAPPPSLQSVYDTLHQLSSASVRLFFQHGNRDFLVGEAFMHQIGAELLPEVHALETPHGTTLLLHGDQLCQDDAAYQAFRQQVRNPQWQAAFLSKSVAERLDVARQLRAASREQGAQKAEYITDVTPSAVSDLMEQHQALLMIHGHTHRPRMHTNQSPQGGVRIVLGDWDASAWYLEQDEEGSRHFAFKLPDGNPQTAELQDFLAAAD
ncbi:UDP-2,3-diacylglucosamine diphosphatase [Marinobacterium sp. AK62]|uniref:UDP-2,3-diacylglucosamine hydrolase n=1 Tax=Marinobacterium alkalitolerans TaxID=1542925 RepID=A0ABS3ZBH0_9GAMM|nr:UDP-2,3-diacylglucosamine diphosphatase [Marinobacterium alkalitolerans]MBP0049055.1 UDP-2,3-diacylglucosamine diphosphatase [Marinobacterium alkalitolerans]